MPPPFDIHEGDSLALARGLADNSIDSIVTDPPAGISFCGKGWDDDKGGRDEWIRWLESIMREAYRALKPGGYALVWAIPRTSHWTAFALENAGFRICDVAHHLFGSGFPKGLDVGKAMDRMRDDDIYHVTSFIAAARDAAGKTNGEIDAFMGFVGMAGHWTSDKSQPAVPKWEYWLKLKEFLQFGDSMDSEVQRLNGRKGKPGDLWYERPIIGVVTDGVEGHIFRKGGAGNTYNKEFYVTGHVSEEAHAWDGWNTALKPGAEHWILAQKPIDARNIAANVLKYGVGALNIRGCEVARASGDVPGWHKSGADGSQGFLGTDTFKTDAQTPEEIQERRGERGRWPSNLLLSHSVDCCCTGYRLIKGCPNKVKQGGPKRAGFHSDHKEGGVDEGPRDTVFEGYGDENGMELMEVWECSEGCPVLELNRQTGIRKGGARPAKRNTGHFGKSNGTDDGERESYDDGYVSRYFNTFHFTAEELEELRDPWRYQPKPTRDEKEAGCEELPLKVLNRVNPGGLENDPRWKPIAVRNNHPTVKSIGLMRWLCRLITPPGGVVLDLFCGSGTTGCGAVLEGFGFIGFDKNENNADSDEDKKVNAVAIARARIGYWASLSDKEGGALPLFDKDGARLPILTSPVRRGKAPKVSPDQQGFSFDEED